MAATPAAGGRHRWAVGRLRNREGGSSIDSKRHLELLQEDWRQDEERLLDLRQEHLLHAAEHHQHDSPPGNFFLLHCFISIVVQILNVQLKNFQLKLFYGQWL